jgi:hypothetical protein
MTTPADELRTAAQRLRDVAPDITGPLTGLADPVADWLEATAADVARIEAQYRDRLAGESMAPHALAVARAINGTAS